MLKRGFTLAEVLITLLIVGVVATLTTPALVKNVGSSKIGPQLAKFVNTFETAAETMMMEENVGTLTAVMTTSVLDPEQVEPPEGEPTKLQEHKNNILDVMSKYMIMTNLKNVTNPKSLDIISSADGSTLKTANFSYGNVWQLKDGTIAFIADVGHPIVKEETGEIMNAKGLLGTLYVDLGGIKGQHRAGKEVFAFKIDDSGYLVPYGSNAHKAIDSSMANVSCNHNGDFNAQLACTGAVADNSYKAPW